MDDLYDEFGNYLGEIEDSEEEIIEDQDDDEWEKDEMVEETIEKDQMEIEDEEAKGTSSAVVLHEDKQYYPDSESIYPGVETLVQDEDTQPLEQPIIKRVTAKKFMITEQEVPNTSFSFEFLTGLMDHPSNIRNLAVAGHIHHGKTSFIDILVQQTHSIGWDPHKSIKYTDSRYDEQARGISIKMSPISLILPNISGKHLLLNLIDCPGHVNFSDETAAALRLSDGLVLVVDAAEGLMVQTEVVLRLAILERIPIIIVLNKIDRLILEIKLPPDDAYHKLVHTIQEINSTLEKLGYDHSLSPSKGHVCFCSAKFDGNINNEKFVRKLWGDYYYHIPSRKFLKEPAEGSKRSFVQFILEPLYKIFSHVLGEEPHHLGPFLSSLGIQLNKTELNLDPAPLLRVVCSRFLSESTGFVETVQKHIPSPVEGTPIKKEMNYTGELTSFQTNSDNTSSQNPLLVHIVKLIPRGNAQDFDALGRIISGTIKKNDQIVVMGENYSFDDQEDCSYHTVSNLWVYNSRYRVEINQASFGNLILIGGVDHIIYKTATLCHTSDISKFTIFRPLRYLSPPVFKVAVEPLHPSELPKMADGMRKISKSFLNTITKVEESGEHCIIGTGEMQLDCILHDLRLMYADIEVKVADPVTPFCETVMETSILPCFAQTANNQNSLTMIAEPLPRGLPEDIESHRVSLFWEPDATSSFFQQEYNWDMLESRSIWAFGADFDGPNIFCDHTLPSERNETLFSSIKDSVIQGFRWAAREGPLCDEPMRGVRFKLLSASISPNPIMRGSGQIIPTARRVAYSSFLLSSPKLLEPYYYAEIIGPADCVTAIYTVLGRRRGHVTQEIPKPGTPLYIIKADLPVIDSIGFETDLRTHTQGQTFVQTVFDRWELVPGDPLDKSIMLRPLEIQPISSLAREFMIKTRRRKGLSEDVIINKYFDEPMLLELAKQDNELMN